ncbi:MAG: hypothetical protein ABIO94_10950, partial [Opitutaceae bacterium]
MKPISIALLLVVSLSINGVLIKRHFRNPPAPSSASVTVRDKGGSSRPTSNLSSVIDHRLPNLVSQLRSSGLPAPLLRVWISAEVEELYHAREQAL